MTMEDVEMICFEIITNVGNARSLYIEAIQEAKKGNFEKADALVHEGEESFTLGHHAHASLGEKEGDGEEVPKSMLLIHAEDQLMSAEAFRILADEFIDLYKRIS